MLQSSIDLDKTSEYYRICPYCKEEFMADHMSREYCNDKCGDNFNNRKKRLVKRINGKLDSSSPTTTHSTIGFEEKIQSNINILNQFKIDKENGIDLPLETLDELGYDSNYFSGRHEIENSTIFYRLTVGSYTICRKSHRKVHIEYIN
jgi:ribosomal protein S27AE